MTSNGYACVLCVPVTRMSSRSCRLHDAATLPLQQKLNTWRAAGCAGKQRLPQTTRCAAALRAVALRRAQRPGRAEYAPLSVNLSQALGAAGGSARLQNTGAPLMLQHCCCNAVACQASGVGQGCPHCSNCGYCDKTHQVASTALHHRSCMLDKHCNQFTGV